jgi:hypothetical protein
MNVSIVDHSGRKFHPVYRFDQDLRATGFVEGEGLEMHGVVR